MLILSLLSAVIIIKKEKLSSFEQQPI